MLALAFPRRTGLRVAVSNLIEWVKEGDAAARAAILALLASGHDPGDSVAAGWAEMQRGGRPTYIEGSRVLGVPPHAVRDAEARLLELCALLHQEDEPKLDQRA